MAEPDLVQAFDLSRGYIRERLIKPLERASEVLEAAIAAQQSLDAAATQLATLEQQTQGATAAATAARAAQQAAEAQAAAATAEARRLVAAAEDTMNGEKKRLAGALEEAQSQHRALLDALKAERGAVQADAERRLQKTLADLAKAQTQMEAMRAHLNRAPA